MKRASAIVTNRGGRTCHAAIIARELGIPAVVGTRDATERVSDGQPVTAREGLDEVMSQAVPATLQQLAEQGLLEA